MSCEQSVFITLIKSELGLNVIVTKSAWLQVWLTEQI